MAGAVIATVLSLMLLGARQAWAVEFVYWDNANDGTLGFSNLEGKGGGPLSTSGVTIQTPEGMSYDPVTNRLYIADAGGGPGTGKLAFVDLDGSGGGTFTPAVTAPLDNPEGLVVDPVARIAYWINAGAVPESISWARLDGSEGGEVEIGATPLLGARRLSLDPAAGWLYWGDAGGSIEYAAVNGTGGGGFAAKTTEAISGISYDPAAGRLYWVEANENKVSSATATEAAPVAVPTGAFAPVNIPWGLAFDPVLANPRLYWANRGNGATREGAIGFTGIPGSGGGGITPSGAPVNGPQDPVIIKSPVNATLPAIAIAPRQLSCSPGSWEPDYVSSFVYEAADSFAYQWTLNDAPIPGATGTTYSPAASGRYKCVVTASNLAGSTSRTSLGVMVTISVTTRPRPTQASTPAKLVLLGKARRLRASPGKRLTLHVQMANQGTVASTPAKLCLSLTRKAKRALIAGECARLGPLPGGATATAKLRLRVKKRAKPGTYKLNITLPGAPATKVTVRVLG